MAGSCVTAGPPHTPSAAAEYNGIRLPTSWPPTTASFDEVSDEFVALLGEDHSQVLREGQFGDQNVQLEDSLIALSLKGYVGAERAQVMALFELFACFPEDVAVPASVFNKMAPVLSNEKSEKKARSSFENSEEERRGEEKRGPT